MRAKAMTVFRFVIYALVAVVAASFLLVELLERTGACRGVGGLSSECGMQVLEPVMATMLLIMTYALLLPPVTALIVLGLLLIIYDLGRWTWRRLDWRS